MKKKIKTEVVVIGAGPGGYAAAFRASDLGKKVTLIEKDENLGGVCLNRGCIPSTALLHLAKIIEESKDAKKKGVLYGTPRVDIKKIRTWKNSIVKEFGLGIRQLAKARKINLINGTATFSSDKELKIKTKKGIIEATFDRAIIATGSTSSGIPFLPKGNKKILNSRKALELTNIPKKLLVVGGGYIGLEMGSVFSALGSKVTIVEMLPHLLDGIDRDLVEPLHKKLSKQTEKIYLNTKITSANPKKEGVEVLLERDGKIIKESFDAILESVGRKPNTKNMTIKNAGLEVNSRGFIKTNNKQQTSIPTIYAIGDVAGEPMLAHKAAYEGIIAAENISGTKGSQFDARAIPAVVFTNPEIAWVGLTETAAKEKSIPYKKGDFPWIASGRAATMGFREGKTKILFNPNTKQVLGAGIVGPGAGDLISEAALAIEMGADADDLAMTIHAHPTLSESIKISSEIFLGTATDLYIPKQKKKKNNE